MTPDASTPALTLAIVQHPPVFLNLAASLERAAALVRDAAARGARWVVFPETWLPGYPVWLDHAPGAALWDHPPAKVVYRRLYEQSLVLPAGLEPLRALVGETGAGVVMGVHERDGGTIYNSMIFVSATGEVAVHRKLVPTYAERLVWGRGDGSSLHAIDTADGRIGGLICWEHWMPLAHAAMQAKNETLHVAQWPWVNPLHQIACRSYAFEGRCFVAAAGCVLTKEHVLDGWDSLGGPSEGRELLESMPGDLKSPILRGGSAVVSPTSEYLVEPAGDREETILAKLDPALIVEGHLTLDTAGHYSRPDVFDLRVNTSPQEGVRFEEGGPPVLDGE